MPSGTRPWCHPDGAEFKGFKNVGAVTSGRFTSGSHKKTWNARQCVTKRAMGEAITMKTKVQ